MIHDKIFLTTINTIPSPIIVTNGKKLISSNDVFLSFFNYADIKKFVKDYACVCNLFVTHEDYFSLDTIDKNTLWTDYLYNKKEKPAIVSLLDKDDNPTIFKITINKLPTYENHYIIIFTDVTAIQNEKKLLEQMAYYDPLTQIYNRQMFHNLLIKEHENKKRHGDALSILMLDIDHFKVVNDTHGHDIGDKVLVTLAKLITKSLRVNDIFARWGGEEFMILLPRTDKVRAYDKAKKLRKIIEEYEDTIIPKITVSFGVTEILESDKDRHCFIRVDKALYQAKIKRNDVVIF